MTNRAPAPAEDAGLLEQALGYAIGTVAVVTPELLVRRTPCRGWDLRRLLWHGCESLAALDEGFTSGGVSLTPRDDSALTASPAEVFTARAHSLLDAWTWLTRPEVLIGGLPLTTPMLAAAGALEVAVHGWDVAQACGEQRPIPAQLADGLLEVAPLLVTGADRGPLFAAPVSVRAEACASDKLTAYLGRYPSPAGFRARQNQQMTELTAAEVLALSALMAGPPMTSTEVARAAAELGMHLDDDYVAATLRSLTAQGLAELTPAASLGKYRIKADGRAWLAAHTAPGNGS